MLSSKSLIFFLVVAMAAGTSLTFTKKIKPIPFLQNHTLVHAKNVDVSKAQAITMSSSLCQNTSGITAPVKRSFNGFFYVELWIGTPPVRANVAIDTGSDLTWVQSADCTKCFPVALPNYDGMKLATYIAMSPHHPLCPDPSPFGHNDTCTYEVSYLGEHLEEEQNISGQFGWDVFTFKSEIRGQQEQQQRVTNVTFGSGIVNHLDTGPEGTEGNPIAGILGLAYMEPRSFLKQLRNFTLKRFSYCLPLDTTPILGHGGHYVQLKGISLNEGLLPIDPKLLAKPISATVIDSGTERRFIIAKAYVVLERAVISYFQDAYGWKPMKNTSKRVDSDLCYKIHRGGRYEFPKLTLHFENAYIDLDRRSSFKEYTRENQFCMTILPIDDNMQNNVLEACQHANHRFLFDVADLKLSFATESC
ncbi:hypothetical protein TB2_019278 [Malus domestica]